MPSSLVLGWLINRRHSELAALLSAGRHFLPSNTPCQRVSRTHDLLFWEANALGKAMSCGSPSASRTDDTADPQFVLRLANSSNGGMLGSGGALSLI